MLVHNDEVLDDGHHCKFFFWGGGGDWTKKLTWIRLSMTSSKFQSLHSFYHFS